jgi:hypothetical protein
MSRRPATCFRSLVTASLTAAALTGCGGGGHEAPAPPPIAASTPAVETQATPTPATTPTATEAPTPAAPAEVPPVTPQTSATGATPPPTPEPNPKPEQQQPEALQWMRDGEARKADYQRRLDEAEANLESANLSMVTWERNVLAFKNPFLARPQLSPEDTQAIAGMDGAQRARWAEGRLSSTSAARDAAQKTLDDLKANPPVN